jgi:hypothetical protein
MPAEDKALRRRVEHEISRFEIDYSMGNVAAINGVIYLSGKVKRVLSPEGRNLDLRKTMVTVAEAIRAINGVSDVVLDCDYIG